MTTNKQLQHQSLVTEALLLSACPSFGMNLFEGEMVEVEIPLEKSASCVLAENVVPRLPGVLVPHMCSEIAAISIS